MSIARLQYTHRHKIQIATYHRHQYCIICNAKIPFIANKKYPDKMKYPSIGRSDIKYLFLKYGLLIKRQRYYCSDPLSTDHMVTSVDDLYNKIPKTAPDSQSKLKSFNQTLIELRKELISKTIELEKKSMQIDNHVCKFKYNTLDIDGFPDFCRITKDNIANLSSTFNLRPNDLLIFFAYLARFDPHIP